MRNILKNKKTMRLAIVGALFLMPATILSFQSYNSADSQNKEIRPVQRMHSSGSFEIADSIFLNKELLQNSSAHKIQMGITAHHLPVARTFIEDFYATLYESEGPRGTFVILGPDHFERCHNAVSTTNLPYHTPFGTMEIDKQFQEKLIKAGASIDSNCFEGEHSIGVQTVFIKYLFPNAKIVPITFSASTDEIKLENLARVLEENFENITIISSVDFSHYRDYATANMLDSQSAGAILSLDENFWTLNFADSPPSLKLILSLAKRVGAEPQIIGSANSYEFGGRYNNTTGYINSIFISSNSSNKTASLVFVGDVMLDRYVDEVFKRRGEEVFKTVRELKQDADLFIFNHEGTFPDVDRPQNLRALLFSFRKEPLQKLKEAGADIAGLANNHSYNFGADVFEQTKKNLKELGFETFGTPVKGTSEKDILKKEIKGNKIIFYGYNQLGGSKEETIQLLGQNSGIGQLDIVSAHWGNEYTKQPSTFQQNTAREFFDAGADVIMGHHPHIVQPYEKIGEKIVFYSLGNFVFDQYFREDVQHGLAIKINVNNNKVEFIPIPISLKQSIPKTELYELLENTYLYPGFSNSDIISIENW